ncbi:hypothetical protein LIER_02466 [Lithospermum erythrorhizon]|uniref:Uncharacterized protein n=1 Tax=Lithospermum erythrorhizon TaxID=34254 RepID=A0AAV3NTC2_LITER
MEHSVGMEEDQESIMETFKPSSLVNFSPFTPIVQPSPRRLSSCFSQAATPVKAARSLAWVSLQGRLVNADEATSAKRIGGGLGKEEAVAWELFSPIHRILIVAVVAVAAMNCRKNREILKLKKCVEMRDQVLSSMQQKLDNLCEQVNYFQNQLEAATDRFTCQTCEQNRLLSIDPMVNIFFTPFKGQEVTSMYVSTGAEAEERRMSALSDWSQSSASASLLDIQLNTEQEVYNLQKECEEKDATIDELSALLHSSDACSSKRIAELEEIIRRKNTMINKFKKDILVLEQKVVNFTRLRRPSYKNAQSSERQLPFMAENVIYDMDSSTGSSSSDTDGLPKRRCKSAATKVGAHGMIPSGQHALKKEHNTRESKLSRSAPKQTGQNQNNLSRPGSPLSEMSLNQTTESATALKSKQMPSTIRDSRSRRPPSVGSKRWL